MSQQEMNMQVLELKNLIEKHFNESNWHDVGLLTNSIDRIEGHPRLLRSYRFGDDDYGSCVSSILLRIVNEDPANLEKIQHYVDSTSGDGSEYISPVPSERRITFAPSVFKVPEVPLQEDLVAVMMPFAGFNAVYAAIKGACEDAELECLRADDIWKDSTFMQDIFDLIFKARIVVCDFSGRNPNVMYETGLAHCLGKTVVPITQSKVDIPSDLGHHRALIYLKNNEGLSELQKGLAQRLRTIAVS